ncbi:MarR family winged helix-turn-helix transcriptional regulator [Mycolicibacterium madagascariense]|uniref:MarR family winged helix-turn-helix transcriptional regulator n=1 Tax=Mycolicibacterium madagascariense TaxID=212765 RepID=UPI001C65CA31|nr:MarR family transcriptional regulator [Mycolicibacterium madagascariense]
MDRHDVTDAARRRHLERLLSADLRELTAQTEWTTREFAERTQLSNNEFRALIFVVVSESTPEEMTATVLRKQMGLSAAAITSLAHRLAEGGFLHKESYPGDRRKVILRPTAHGADAVRGFFAAVARDTHVAMADLPDEDLEAAHRAFAALVEAMKDFRAHSED